MKTELDLTQIIDNEDKMNKIFDIMSYLYEKIEPNNVFKKDIELRTNDKILSFLTDDSYSKYDKIYREKYQTFGIIGNYKIYKNNNQNEDIIYIGDDELLINGL